MLTTSLAQLLAMHPCVEGRTIAVNVLPHQPITAREARAAGLGYDDILWGMASISREDPEFNHRLHHWLDDCHNHAIALAQGEYPLTQRAADLRARHRDFQTRRLDAAVRAATRAAGRVAWAKASAAAGMAARSSVAAAAATGGNVRASATDQATAAWNTARDEARLAEQRWQFDRLIEWFSDPPPPVARAL